MCGGGGTGADNITYILCILIITLSLLFFCLEGIYHLKKDVGRDSGEVPLCGREHRGAVYDQSIHLR